jgi:hypothetical protein
MSDLVADIIAFETGALSKRGVLQLFARLIETGQAWTLQGSYGRAANGMIEAGLITEDGEIVVELGEVEDEADRGPADPSQVPVH